MLVVNLLLLPFRLVLRLPVAALRLVGKLLALPVGVSASVAGAASRLLRTAVSILLRLIRSGVSLPFRLLRLVVAAPRRAARWIFRL